MSHRIGQIFGSYKLVKLLGRGGFATVYLGQNIRLSQQIAAIKVLDKLLIVAKSSQFQREASIIATLRHPNIIQMYDYNILVNPQMTTTLYPYIVMEYAPKGSLRVKHPRGQALPLKTIITYTSQIADALQYAHDKQIMHLDVKPENILINEQDKLLLSDFGLATLLSEEEKTGDIQGTLSYMSPEQLDGKPCFASDQYALGIMVYEWLSGQLPFTGQSVQEVIKKHLMMPPPALCTLVNTLSPQIEAVVNKALAKNPADRYPTVEAFAEAFNQAASTVKTRRPANVVMFPKPDQAGANSPSPVLKQPTPQPGAGPLFPVANQATPQLGANTPSPVPNQPTPMPGGGPLFPVPNQAGGNAPSPVPNQPTPMPAANPLFAVASPPTPQPAGNTPSPAANSPAQSEPASASEKAAPGMAAIQPQPGMANFLNPVGGVVSPWPGNQAVSPPFGNAQAGFFPPPGGGSPFMAGPPPGAPSANQQPGGTSPFLNTIPSNPSATTVFGLPGSPPVQGVGPLPAYLTGNSTPPAFSNTSQPWEKSLFTTTQVWLKRPPAMLRRRRQPWFVAGLFLNFLGAVLIGVWLGRITQTPGQDNETGWWGLLLSLALSLGATFLFFNSGNKYVNSFLTLVLTVYWGFVGYALGALTHGSFLPDYNILAVLFFLGSLGLHVYLMFKRR